MKEVRRVLLAVACATLCAQAYAGQEGASVSGELIVFHAGSLSVPMKKIAEAFNREYPQVRVASEAAGSVACARKITELKRPCDVVVSADYAMIEKLLIPKHASWNIKFSGNEIAIVYDDKSRGADEINSNNWHDVLMRDDVTFGRSDPNSDPCGYRAVLTIKLTEKHYGKPGLADRLLGKDLEYIRPKETDLLALLETHEIDYIFLYRSVAEQHGLKYVILPDQINLKSESFADFYKTVSVEVSGEQPGKTMTVHGEPIAYGITIPSAAPNPQAALAFVEFLLEKENGMAILEKHGQHSLIPSPTGTFGSIPDPLKKFAEEANVTPNQ